MDAKTQKFNQLIIEAIDEVLCSLGEPVKNQLYIVLENVFFISKNELPMQIEEFSKFLFRIFGPAAYALEIKFMKNLYSKINNDHLLEHNFIVLKETDMSFLSYVNKIHESFEVSKDKLMGFEE
jgi:hypothetical protein